MDISYRNPQWKRIFSLSLDVHLLMEMYGVPEWLQILHLYRGQTTDLFIPDHTHPVHHAESTVKFAKRNLKRKASGAIMKKLLSHQ